MILAYIAVAGAAAFSAAVYAADGSPANLGAAIFCGFSAAWVWKS